MNSIDRKKSICWKVQREEKHNNWRTVHKEEKEAVLSWLCIERNKEVAVLRSDTIKYISYPQKQVPVPSGIFRCQDKTVGA